MGGGLQTSGEASGGGEMDPETERHWRKTSLMIQNNLSASTGLLHTSYAGSGATGSLRVGFITSYFTGTGFLCSGGKCNYNLATNPQGNSDDEVTRIGAHLSMNATPLPFLEAYLGFHATATENDQSRPRLLQVLGDTNIGLKGFMPWQPDSIFSVGGEAQLWLLNGTGGVGLDGSGTSYALRALATADLANRMNPDDRIPLKSPTPRRRATVRRSRASSATASTSTAWTASRSGSASKACSTTCTPSRSGPWTCR
jgi:hypothetical protein